MSIFQVLPTGALETEVRMPLFQRPDSTRETRAVRYIAGRINAQINRAMRLALGRAPEPDEQARLVDFAGKHGLENACRVILNLNEFSFID
jgi:hypothetical protein